MTDKIVALTTCSSAEEAERIAHRLLEARLAACVTILPGARSLYWWQGTIENSAEILLLIKSSRPHIGKLHAEIEKIHSYEVPEFIVMSIVDGSPNYLNWMESELGTI